jgi:chromatin modification-related protein VID21
MQMQQRQLQMQQQLPGQTPSLAAAHLSPSGANMPQNQQQMIAAALQRAALVNGSANGMVGGGGGIGAMAGVSSPSGNPGMPSQLPGQLSSGHTPALIAIQHQIQQKYPHLSPDQVRNMANETLKNQFRQSALNAAAGGVGGMQGQNLAQQHLGLHGQSPQQQQMMAAFAAQNGLNGNGMPGSNAPNGGSPTQMYRNMAASHQAAARMTSGSPAGMSAGGSLQMSDSRSGTPNGMARSLSGAGGSPVMGPNGMGR